MCAFAVNTKVPSRSLVLELLCVHLLSTPRCRHAVSCWSCYVHIYCQYQGALVQSCTGVAMCAFAALASAAELSVTHVFTCLLCHTWSAFCANMLLLVMSKHGSCLSCKCTSLCMMPG